MTFEEDISSLSSDELIILVCEKKVELAEIDLAIIRRTQNESKQ